MKKLCFLTVFLCFFLTCMGFGSNRTMAAAGAGQEPGEFEGSIREEELETQVREYYDGFSERDVRKMELSAGTESRQMRERNEALWSSGVEAIEVVDLIIYPCERYRIVIVSYDMEIEGVGTKAPGAQTLVAEETAEGGFQLLFFEGAEQELPEDNQEMLRQKIKEIAENQDVVDFFREVNERYIAAREDADLREWEENWQMEQSRAIQESETGRRKTDSSAAFYVVKEGDCLWAIAGDMLGDSRKWDAIYEKNKDVIGENPNRIMPGMELELP